LKQYRKKPVVVEAIQLKMENIEALQNLADQGLLGTLTYESEPSDYHRGRLWAEIETLEGKMLAREGDWIIKGIRGEFYSCRVDIFEETYEAL
jgi:hypothetical protein